MARVNDHSWPHTSLGSSNHSRRTRRKPPLVGPRETEPAPSQRHKAADLKPDAGRSSPATISQARRRSSFVASVDHPTNWTNRNQLEGYGGRECVAKSLTAFRFWLDPLEL